MKFRPCIDLHDGCVKQIVGSTLKDHGDDVQVNFSATRPSSYFASMYKRDELEGGHVIMLGPGNEDAAAEALAAYPGGLQVGGGITEDNAAFWLDKGAGAVIVTSYVFSHGKVHEERLKSMVKAVGKEHLVIDLSCRRRGAHYYVVTDRWQNFTEMIVGQDSLDFFSQFSREFLVHGVDVEGKCAGIDEVLVQLLGRFSPLPTTYAGGVQNMEDLDRVKSLGRNRLDVTIGSALDIFGGSGVLYADAVAFNRREAAAG